MASLSPAEIENGKRIDEIVFRFQAGESNALEEVVREFGGDPKEKVHSYIAKYFHMLRYGRFNFDDKDSRIFISCYMTGAASEAMKKPYQYYDTRVQALKALSRLMDQCKAISDEELLQDLRMLFVLQAKRYKHKKKNVWFPGYLYKSFGYALVDLLQNKKFKKYDPYMHMYTDKQLIPMQEDIHVDDDTCIKLDERTFISQPMLADDDELGNSWVRGLTCGDEFVKLTQLQRLIIKLHYQDGLSDAKIASRTGMHINTIHKQRKRSVQIIQETVEELFKGGCEQ